MRGIVYTETQPRCTQLPLMFTLQIEQLVCAGCMCLVSDVAIHSQHPQLSSLMLLCVLAQRAASVEQAVMHVCCRRKQKENQEDLLKRVNEETLRQLRHNQDDNNQSGSGGGRQVSEVVAYRSISDMPSVQHLAIQV